MGKCSIQRNNWHLYDQSMLHTHLYILYYNAIWYDNIISLKILKYIFFRKPWYSSEYIKKWIVRSVKEFIAHAWCKIIHLWLQKGKFMLKNFQSPLKWIIKENIFVTNQVVLWTFMDFPMYRLYKMPLQLQLQGFFCVLHFVLSYLFKKSLYMHMHCL